MKMPEQNRRDLAVSTLLSICALALFASPFTESWAGFRPPWYLPYTLWALLIGLAAVLAQKPSGDDR
jgi:hypothetical protein